MIRCLQVSPSGLVKVLKKANIVARERLTNSGTYIIEDGTKIVVTKVKDSKPIIETYNNFITKAEFDIIFKGK